jgi:RsiW-degrading membrane proteinase PrsW (M82 family)
MISKGDMEMLTLLSSVPKIMIAAAVLPAMVLLIYVYRKDVTEKEPGNLLFNLLLLGALSTVFASMTELLGQHVLDSISFESETMKNAILYFIVVALSEEGFKYLLLRYRTWKEPNFNCTFDGVVYAVFVSMGFAIIENIKYVFAYGLATALVRAVTAVPGHACFGVFMGVFYGLAKRHQSDPDGGAACRKYGIAALVVPVLLHGLYDFTATSSQVYIFFAVIIAIMFAAVKAVNAASRNDSYV